MDNYSARERLQKQANGIEGFLQKHGSWLLPLLLIIFGFAFSNKIAVGVGLFYLLYCVIQKARKKD